MFPLPLGPEHWWECSWVFAGCLLCPMKNAEISALINLFPKQKRLSKTGNVQYSTFFLGAAKHDGILLQDIVM